MYSILFIPDATILDKHIQYVHKRTFQCDQCQKSFERLPELIQHCDLGHHNGQESSQIVTEKISNFQNDLMSEDSLNQEEDPLSCFDDNLQIQNVTVKNNSLNHQMNQFQKNRILSEEKFDQVNKYLQYFHQLNQWNFKCKICDVILSSKKASRQHLIRGNISNKNFWSQVFFFS